MGDDIALSTSEVITLLELTSQHPAKTLRTDHTETLRSAELHRETCRLGTRKSLPLLTGTNHVEVLFGY